MTRLAYGLRLCSTVARRSARPPHHTPLTSGLAGARRQVSQVPNPGDPSPLPNTLDNGSEGKQQQQEGNGSASSNAASGLRDTVVTTACGIALLALGGIGYHQWYKWDQLRKIAIAFEAGYDPVLELDSTSNVQQEEERRSKAEDELEYFPHEDAHLRRSQQALVDRIVDGVDQGHYWLVMGPKGVGKGTMFVDAIRKNMADGVAMLEAHEDGEVVRLRFGKALNFDYYEDSFSGLFQRRDPREGGPLLDIERLMNKLEKVSINFARQRGRPLCLIINNMHLIEQSETGYALLHALQQRAESWAQAKTCTMAFLTDDYWVYKKMKKNATRLQVLNIGDLSEIETVAALRANHPRCKLADAREIHSLIGGRLAHLSTVVKVSADKMVQRAKALLETEKQWLLSKRPLIPDHDDDVMDAMKESSCAWLLFQALAERYNKLKEEREAAGLPHPDYHEVSIPYWEACVIMTRPDYLLDLDFDNIIYIDMNHQVRADSAIMMNVMREVSAEDDFQENLDQTRDRVDAIESLHRTNELVIKDNEGVFKIAVGRG